MIEEKESEDDAVNVTFFISSNLFIWSLHFLLITKENEIKERQTDRQKCREGERGE